MTRRTIGCLTLALLLSISHCFAIGRQVELEQPGNGTHEIPFEIVNGHLIEVRGSIGALTNLHFLVEVGTPRTMLDTQLGQGENDGGAQDKTKPPAPIVASQHSEIVLRQFSLGSIPMPEIRVISTDLSQMPAVPRGTAGIVGLDILHRQNVTIDYVEKKLYLSAKTGGEHQARMVVNDVGLAIDSNWQGSPLKLVLSTGVEALALDEERVRQRAIKLPEMRKDSLSTDENMPASLFELRELTLGNVKLSGMGVVRKMEWPEGSEQLMGFLPLAALRAKRVSLDFDRNLLFWDSRSGGSEKASLATNEVRPGRKP